VLCLHEVGREAGELYRYGGYISAGRGAECLEIQNSKHMFEFQILV